jgi:hypothetical protein
MTTVQISQKTDVPAFIRRTKNAESRNFQTMLILLLVDIAFVGIAVIVSIPFSIILPVAAGFVVVIAFFGYRASKYAKMLTKIDAELKRQIEFYRFVQSI